MNGARNKVATVTMLNCRTSKFLILSILLLLFGCRRERTGTIEGFIEMIRGDSIAKSILAQSYGDVPQKPRESATSKQLRILTPVGYLDKYIQVTPKIPPESFATGTLFFLRNNSGHYTKVENPQNYFSKGEINLYARVKAPAVQKFEADFGIEIEIEHIPEGGRVVFTGLTPEEMADYDLVFAPRFLIPPLLNREHLRSFNINEIANLPRLQHFMEDTFFKLPNDMDLEYAIPYYRIPLGIAYNRALVDDVPRTWEYGFTFERHEAYWFRTSFLKDPIKALALTLLYELSMPTEERQAHRANVDILLAKVEEVLANDDPPGKKAAALDDLRHEYAYFQHGSPHDSPSEQPIRQSAEIAPSIEKRQYVVFDENYRPEEKFPQSESMSVLVESAAGKLKKSALFGASFFKNEEVLNDVSEPSWALLVGSSGDPYMSMRHGSEFRFSIPDKESLIQFDVFVLPRNPKTAQSKATSEFFIDYLLSPKIAASMSAFTLRAALVREAVSYLPSEIVNTSIYSLPARGYATFFPIIDGELIEIEPIWNDILEFEQIITHINRAH